MAADKGTRRKRLRTLPDRMQRLLAFGTFAASFEVPPDRRAEEMVAGLQFFVDLLHAEGYAAPRWLLRPLWYFQRGVQLHDPEHERPTTHLMLGLLEGLVEDLPEEVQPDALRQVIYFFRGIYEEGSVEPPEWLQIAQDRYGEDEGDELPVDLMLDVVDASLLNLPEEARPEARREVLEMFAGIFASRGHPVPEWVRVGLES